MAKTKEPKELSTLEQLEDKIEQLVRENDALLRIIVADQDSKPNPSQLAYFRNQGWDVTMTAGNDRHQKNLLRELHRMERVIDAEMVAGTPAQRQALEDELATAKAEAETKLPAIDEQIEKLKRERFAIVAKLERLPKRLDECQAALVRLREELPIELQQQRDAALNELYASTDWREVRSMKGRKVGIEAILQLSPHSEQALLHCQAQRTSRPGLLEKDANRQWTVNGAVWNEYITELRLELAAIDESLPAKQADMERVELEIKQSYELYGKQ